MAKQGYHFKSKIGIFQIIIDWELKDETKKSHEVKYSKWKLLLNGEEIPTVAGGEILKRYKSAEAAADAVRSGQTDHDACDSRSDLKAPANLEGWNEGRGPRLS
jgi:hypothetical protein